MTFRIVAHSRTQPAHAILTIITVLTFLAGLFILTPFYMPVSAGPIVSESFNTAVIIGGLANTIASTPALIAVKRNRPRQLAQGAFWLCLWYLFVTLARINLYGPTGLSWVVTLIIALVLAVLYIEQAHLARKEDSVE